MKRLKKVCRDFIVGVLGGVAIGTIYILMILIFG